MKAALITDKNQLALRETDLPVAGPSDILAKVHAAALNRADVGVLAAGLPAGGAAYVAGREFAGEVVAVGSAVRDFKPGDRVMAYGMGAFAELTKVDHRLAMRVPAALGWDEAAASPLGLQTMHDALVTQGRLAAGEAVLIHGAASGMGIMGIRMAKALGAAQVIGTSRSDEKLKSLAAFGMDAGVNIGAADWPRQVRALTGGKGVNVVVDMVTGGTVAGSLAAAAVLGRIVNVGRLGGSAGAFDFDVHALNRLSYIGVTFRTRSTEEIQALILRAEKDLGARIGDGTLAIPVSRVFSLDAVVEAHEFMRSNAHLGKILIKP